MNWIVMMIPRWLETVKETEAMIMVTLNPAMIILYTAEIH